MLDRAIGVAVLAAGASRRFGQTDKLTAMFRGRPLGEHVCAAIPPDGFARRWVIASSADHPCATAWDHAGFRVAVNKRANEGMGTSVALAARLAMETRCTALLIALADMPFVPAEHFEALTLACTQSDDALCSISGEVRMPPAIFGEDHLPRLTALTADRGARALLADAQTLTCPPEWLVDIDTPEALARHA